MSQPIKAFCGAGIFDGKEILSNYALVVFADHSTEIWKEHRLPERLPKHIFSDGTLVPGFVDLQVNGGGGVMFNDCQSVKTLETIAHAHKKIGTRTLLPTLITDTVERTQSAINAVDKAIKANVEGIAGIHLEGPHLSVARKGAHDANLIRKMDESDVRVLLDAANRLPNVMLTVAPENTTSKQIKTLSDAGIIVSLGHTQASYDTCMAAFEAGASCATHLFNAMSQLGNRDPGLVGAVLAHGGVHAGIIADGIHVHPVAIQTALAAKKGPGKVFLVTDAMATAGSEITNFNLNGRTIQRKNARLTLSDGTLAGADLDLCTAISVLVNEVGLPLLDAVSKATTIPMSLLSGETSGSHLSQDKRNWNYIDASLQKIQHAV